MFVRNMRGRSVMYSRYVRRCGLVVVIDDIRHQRGGQPQVARRRRPRRREHCQLNKQSCRQSSRRLGIRRQHARIVAVTFLRQSRGRARLDPAHRRHHWTVHTDWIRIILGDERRRKIAYSPTVSEAGGGSGLDSVFVDDTDIAVGSHPVFHRRDVLVLRQPSRNHGGWKTIFLRRREHDVGRIDITTRTVLRPHGHAIVGGRR